MTAEIAILNRSAIAMAADSAVTIGARTKNGTKRVWKTSNKIFSLSPENDIAVMIYGTGDFCGVPWETIIKLFSQKKTQRYETVEKCRAEFIDFISSFTTHNPEYEELNTYFLILNVVDSLTNKSKEGSTRTESKEIVDRELSKFEEFFKSASDLAIDVSLSDFSSNYKDMILDAFKSDIAFKASKVLCDRIVRTCHAFFERKTPSGFETGLVFGGFGHDEFFPCMSTAVVDGKSAFGVRWWNLSTPIVMDTWKSSSAHIQPFAQADIAHLFIEGIDKGYLDFMETTILGALNKKSQDVVKTYVAESDKLVEAELQSKEDKAAIQTIMRDFRDLRHKSIVEPMMSVVRNLPKEEMAAMAESLVEITSLRRRMDSDIESVAGPVDVVVVSKGDGLIWMKRKHYFDVSKNADFLHRRRARREDD